MSLKDLDRFRVPQKNSWKLTDIDPDGTPGCKTRQDAEARLEELRLELIEQQNRLYAGGEYGLLLVLQGLDASGKDGTIRRVMSGVNPQGCHVSSFKVPSAVEANHDFLWRIHHSVPARGRFVIFNRSHYEDVIVVRVHADAILPEWAKRRKNLWEERYEQINNFEKMLTQNNIAIVKCYLHISKDEQKKRLVSRLDDTSKNWKFDRGDLSERQHWDDYMDAYQKALRATSTDWAPWHVIPANCKWYRNLVLGELLVDTLKSLKLKYPKADPELLKDVRID